MSLTLIDALLPVAAQPIAPQLFGTPLVPALEPPLAEFGGYQAEIASTEADRMAAYRLRFLVFNLEMQEGLQSAYETGHDTDRYDEVCDQLIVKEKSTGNVIGTYRLQMGNTAGRHYGYYSEQEFDFSPYESIRATTIELGRACIHKDHRSAEVLNLLWRGIMRYALQRGGRYLIGCCSLTSQSTEEGMGVFAAMSDYMAEPAMQTQATAEYRLPDVPYDGPAMPPPKLLRAYLAIGAKICGPPAIDREFKTIDFLTMIDLQTMNPRIARRFL